MEDRGLYGIPEDEDQVEILLSYIDKSWFENRSNWRFIGECIRNIAGNSGKETWKRYTPQQFESTLDTEWNSFVASKYGISAMRCIAKDHSPEEFSEWQTEVTNSAILGSLDETAAMTEIADIARFLFGDVFACSNVEHRSWWCFSNHRWEMLSGGHSFRQKFSRVLVGLYQKILPALHVPEDKSDPEANLIKGMRTKCMNIIRGLKDPGFKSKLMLECAESFFIENFEEDLDENHYLLGLPDGVLDLKTFEKRRGYPEDRLTLKMGVSYYPDRFSESHPEVVAVRNFFKKVLHDDDLVTFALRHKATCLMGGNQEKWCVIYVGETAHNGKTTIQKWDRTVFGSYCGKFPLGSIVGKTLDAGTADPAQATSKGQRLKYADEANREQKFNFSFMKTATGNDEIWARKLYSNGSSFTPQYTLILALNQPPEAGVDAAIWERIVMLPYDSRFIAQPPEDPAEQERTRTYKANPFIVDELKKLGEAYLWILVDELKNYFKQGIRKPKSVLKKTEIYKFKNDPYAQFAEAKIQKTDREADYVALTDLYIHFKRWRTDAFPKATIPDKQVFQDEMTRVLGAPEGPEKRWYSVKVKADIRRFDQNE